MKILRIVRALLSRRSTEAPARAQGKAVPALKATGAVSRPITGNVPEIIVHRRRQAWRTVVQMTVVVGLPTLLGAVYYGLVASDRYVSEMQIVIHSESGGGGASDLLSLMGLGVPGGAPDHAAMLYQYIQSPAMLSKLDSMLNLRDLWGTENADWISRLNPQATQEELQDYFRKRIEVIGDTNSSIITLRAEAFSPTEAQLILEAVVVISEDVLNRVFAKKREDTITFARNELRSAEERLAEAQQAINAFRHEHGEMDPARTAEAVGSIGAAMMGELASARAELEGLLNFMRPDSPQVRAQRDRILALENQIKAGRRALTNESPSDYADLLLRYQNLLIEETFAQETYASAMAFYGTARADARRQHSYVIDFVSPTLPDEAVEPARIRSVATILIGAFLAYAIGALVLAAIREQARL